MQTRNFLVRSAVVAAALAVTGGALLAWLASRTEADIAAHRERVVARGTAGGTGRRVGDGAWQRCPRPCSATSLSPSRRAAAARPATWNSRWKADSGVPGANPSHPLTPSRRSRSTPRRWCSPRPRRCCLGAGPDGARLRRLCRWADGDEGQAAVSHHRGRRTRLADAEPHLAAALVAGNPAVADGAAARWRRALGGDGRPPRAGNRDPGRHGASMVATFGGDGGCCASTRGRW